jgi:hypothetical protein
VALPFLKRISSPGDISKDITTVIPMRPVLQQTNLKYASNNDHKSGCTLLWGIENRGKTKLELLVFNQTGQRRLCRHISQRFSLFVLTWYEIW